ncbi:hypothetical protein OHA72_53010 [Dactylosporangium sp. NBC_01737]|uniref:hypothetical protein n=1 Tax=Dactylosporangium sp. NBC_01737 TaxID=2975959 RepID=UPI002E0F8534|nr:hypothetical protein OHA72_53010 [Dactylosporangium sp. NBC_01737]
MGHNIVGLLLPGPCDRRAVTDWDVTEAPLGGGLSLAHLTHYYTAYWQARRGETGLLDLPAGLPPVFPRERVVLRLAAALTGTAEPTFALVMTDYFGGAGDQWACVFTAGQRTGGVRTVNDALRALGVQATGGTDEFDTVGLGRHRHTPDRLDRYEDLCAELGI